MPAELSWYNLHQCLIPNCDQPLYPNNEHILIDDIPFMLSWLQLKDMLKVQCHHSTRTQKHQIQQKATEHQKTKTPNPTKGYITPEDKNTKSSNRLQNTRRQKHQIQQKATQHQNTKDQIQQKCYNIKCLKCSSLSICQTVWNLITLWTFNIPFNDHPTTWSNAVGASRDLK